MSLILTNIKKHVFSSYGYKIVCVDDKFRKLFKSHLGEDAVYNFISSMIEESKYCSDVMKNHYNKEPVMTKKDNEDFENSTKCWICNNDYIDNDTEVRHHCHITGKYRSSAHRYCNINVKLNNKIPVVFLNLKNHDSHLIMQQLGKFIRQINNKLSFINSFRFLSSSLDRLVKN